MLGIFLVMAVAAPPEAPQGKLVAVGGGGTTDEIVKRTLELAGGAKARVLIVPQASAASDGKASAEMWRSAGAKETTILRLDDRENALTAIRSADLIWMPGGDQNRLMKALAGAKLVEAIRERYENGAVVGGTSAGAAVLSGVMLTIVVDGGLSLE